MPSVDMPCKMPVRFRLPRQKDDFKKKKNMELKITIDVTPALRNMASELAAAICGRVTEIPASQDEVTGKFENESPVTDENTEKEKSQEEVSPGYPDDEELKQHMDLCITKFAGTGWKESKDPESTAIRKGCAKAFKDISKWLGAEKPTALDGEKRLEFVKRLEEIFIEHNEGKLPEIVFRPF